MNGYQIVLASSSPRRYEIIHESMGIEDFITMKPNFEEDLDKSLYIDNPIAYVHDTCLGKAKSILEELRNGSGEGQSLPNIQSPAIIICADTVVIGPDNMIYEKPGDRFTQLGYLSKFCYEYKDPIRVVTSVTLIEWNTEAESNNEDRLLQFEEATKLYFDRDIPREVLLSYVETDDGLQVAGGFKIQGPSGTLIERIEGDYYNVVGLPLNKTYRALLSITK